MSLTLVGEARTHGEPCPVCYRKICHVTNCELCGSVTHMPCGSTKQPSNYCPKCGW
jgi:hypothetical protein